MKRLLTLILAFLMLFVVSACSNDTDISSTNVDAAANKTESALPDTSSKEQSSTVSKTEPTVSDTNSVNQDSTTQSDVGSTNQAGTVSRTESMLSSDMCGQTPRQVKYYGQKDITIKVGEQKFLDFWTYPHHTDCGSYEYIIEDESVLKIPSSDWGMYDEPIKMILPTDCTVEGVKPGKTTLTYKVTSAEGTESVTLNITVVE